MAARQTEVLVVDDEQALRNFVRRNLEVRNYRVHTAANGLEALAHFQSHTIDLVILDLMMPHMDGLETIRRIRQTSQVPIIVLSALGEEEDKIRAFKLGADDYLTKPFGVGELLVRIQAVMRRAQWMPRSSPTTAQIIHDELNVDLERHKVSRGEAAIDLTPIEFELLVYLMENAGKVLTHRAILQHVWGEEYGQESEYLRVYVGRLRQKIEPDPTKPRYILTERGVGYVFGG
ncbi:MAG: response regulator transcription factor [Anaerolineae bacterium]|nr:response regulator transcription factor [Anaerolineae bacterium]